MRHLWWGLIPVVAALVAIRAWLVELAEITGLVTLVCALAGQSRCYRPTRDQRFVCLPDTLDPRGPKGRRQDPHASVPRMSPNPLAELLGTLRRTQWPT
jgi:hypothetical protein